MSNTIGTAMITEQDYEKLFPLSNDWLIKRGKTNKQEFLYALPSLGSFNPYVIT